MHRAHTTIGVKASTAWHAKAEGGGRQYRKKVETHAQSDLAGSATNTSLPSDMAAGS